MVSISNYNCIFENIDTVFFDKDGTFIDSHLYWGQIIKRRSRCLLDFYSINENKSDDICLSMGYDTISGKLIPEGPIALLPRCDVTIAVQNKLSSYGIDALKCDIEKIFDEVHEEFRSSIQKETATHVKILDGAEELFLSLKERNVKLGVITSDSRKNTEKILEYLNITQYFDLVMGKDDCDEPKRTGKPALVALKKLHSNPHNSISVGDAKMDFDMAFNADLEGAILVSTGQTPFSTLLNYTPFAVKSLREFKIK